MHWILTEQDTGDSLHLHGQFSWVDEFSWQALMTAEPIYTITGAVFIETAVKKAGRNITLDGQNAYLTRAQLRWLWYKTCIGGKFWLDTPDDRRFEVVFAPEPLTQIQALIDYHMQDKSDDDPYRANLHLLTV